MTLRSLISPERQMPLHPAEEATVRAFVVPAKRERMLTFLASTKRRKRALAALNHFTGWDPRYAKAIPSSADALHVLRQAGAGAECHVISEDPELDGQDLPLEEAVAAAEVFSFASVLCCVPGDLACYFDEAFGPRKRFLLRRPAGAQLAPRP